MRSINWTFVARLNLAIICSTIVLAGCDGAMSQKDMFARAISRGDDDDDEDEEDDAGAAAEAVASTPASPPPVTPAQPNNSTTVTPAATAASTNTVPANTAPANTAPASTAPANTATPPAAVASAAVATPTVSADGSPGAQTPLGSATEVGGETIADRRPDAPLTQEESRKRTAENIDRITDALLAWMESSYKVPTSIVKDRRGLPGLSWRVKILPLLGYESLYNRFNLKEPWDSPTNKPLLELIPDEFVCFERFDTNTNLQLVVNEAALFSTVEEKDKSEISDAPMIVLLVEVDDNYAVPWTAPFDYEVPKKNEKPLNYGIGNKREDGVFMGWMTGDAALWPKPVDPAIFMRAVTFEAGDGVNFARYLEYPPALPGGSSRPSFVSGGSGFGSNSSAGSSLAGGSSSRVTGAAGFNSNPGYSSSSAPTYSVGGRNNYTRVPMPEQQAILEAEQKVRETYIDAFKLARTPAEFAQLAKRIEKQVMEGTLPPAELFVGLRTAMNVAIRARSPDHALRVLELIDAQFEIDRNTFDQALVTGFIGDKGTLRTELSKSAVLLPVLRNVVQTLVDKDDYREAAKFVSYGAPLLRVLSDDEAAFQWKMMSERVKEGKSIFPKIAHHVEQLDSDPDNARANYVVGWYLCLIKDNWGEGLQMLAKSDNDELRGLAQLEGQDSINIVKHVRLGDAWWDYAEKNKDEDIVFETSLRRARKWYQSASVGLADGLDRIKANNRLTRIDNMIGRDPESLITRSSIEDDD